MSSYVIRGDARRCSVDGCEDNFRITKGLCNKHYLRLRKFGEADFTGTPRLMTSEQRFWSKVKIRPGQCWIWQGGIGSTGYGRYRVKKDELAHRYAYELTNGPIPLGYQIDHTCGVLLCCNPSHLEPVTHQENQRRRRKSMCAQGHPYDLVDNQGRQVCRACRAKRLAAQRARSALLQ